MIPLSALVKIREVVVPRELNHFGQRRSATITSNLSADYSMGEALDFMDATAKKYSSLAMPPTSTAAVVNFASRLMP